MSMWRRKYRVLKSRARAEFPALGLVVVGGLLAAGFLLEKVAPLLSILLGGVNLVLFVVYFVAYLNLFRSLNDLYDGRRFYLKIYDVTGLVFYNLLFFLNITFLIYITNKVFSPYLSASGAISFYAVLLFTAENIIDTVTFGLLDTFSWSYSTLEISGVGGKSVIYIYNLIVEFIILATLVRELSEKVRTSRELKNLSAGKPINQEFFKEVSPKKLTALARVFSNSCCPTEYRREILQILAGSQSKEVKNIFIKVFIETDCEAEVLACLDYFKTNRDHRFHKQARRVKAQWKRELVFSEGKGS